MNDETPQHPTSDDDRAGWQAYWKAQGMAWRTEPEIDAGRQHYLAERRAVQPDIEKGIYSFRDENGCIKLTRADVEWLLATHKSEGHIGPVRWEAEKDKDQRQRRPGVDLRGADLRGSDLQQLPLAQLVASLSSEEWEVTSSKKELREFAAARMEGVLLSRAHLEGASLRGVHLERADLSRAHLEKASLTAAHLAGVRLFVSHLEGTYFGGTHFEGKAMSPEDVAKLRAFIPDFPEVLFGATLRMAYVDQSTDFYRSTFGHPTYGSFSVVDVRWSGANLARTKNWPQVKILGDEEEAHRRIDRKGQLRDKTKRLNQYQVAVRANRQLAVVLRTQGMNEHADRFAYRAQLIQRQVLRRQGIRKWPAYIGSLLLDLLAGYGYRPGRAIWLYLAVIIWFANLYVWASHGLITLGLPPSQVDPLAWYEALILSVSSFHGRGFQPFQHLNDPVAALAGMQAIFGLVIEVSFIATFTQRYFGK